ncbi:MAG: hypothetical protein O2983_15925 [Planctomycetota bacterium]|nr:hypothetical protein [Planctomycetota bacterium]MDA0920267.1 hypothetical protein [Planctomycetota bacterium]MDA1161093.1 hypothetical protein [Planctomycetota bacterium]
MSMSQLDREEYIEQAYFWETFLTRMKDGVPAQEIILQVQDEILATTKLPMALHFLVGEIRHRGRISDGMAQMSHYFTPFQAFLMNKAEDEKTKFDLQIALAILRSEAEFRASDKLTPQGLFIFQFECVARNRLGYDYGMQAVANDPMFDDTWRDWILWLRNQLGSNEFCEFLYLRSDFAVEEKRRALDNPNWKPPKPMLFGVREGRIAKANRGKDPLYMFAALERQLGYPEIPRPTPKNEDKVFHPLVEQRFDMIEKRLSVMEQELKGGIDLEQFYKKPDSPPAHN